MKATSGSKMVVPHFASCLPVWLDIEYYCNSYYCLVREHDFCTMMATTCNSSFLLFLLLLGLLLLHRSNCTALAGLNSYLVQSRCYIVFIFIPLFSFLITIIYCLTMVNVRFCFYYYYIFLLLTLATIVQITDHIHRCLSPYRHVMP